MQDFDSLKDMWQHPASKQVNPQLPVAIGNAPATAKMKLQKHHLAGAVMLALTAVFIAALALFGNLGFIYWYTYGAMVLICIICVVQAWILYSTYNKIKSIDDTLPPAEHLLRWEAYYDLRQRQIKWNLPLYFILLNTAMGIYFIEIFSGRPVKNVIILITIYLAWMLFSYFYLGKKNMKKENKRLQKIIDELKAIEEQLNKED